MESTLSTHKNKKTEKVESSGLKMLLKLYYLSLLKIKKLEELKYKREATSNPENVQLWKDTEKFLLDLNFEQSYNKVQIANKWKNLIDNYKVFFKRNN